MISIILVQYNNGALTLDAVRTLRAHSFSPHEIIVVDNASTDDSLQLVRKNLQDITVIANTENRGFGGANDLAARQARGQILLFLNNDTICQKDILTPAEGAFARDEAMGVLGPAITYPDGSFQLSAGWLPSFWREIVEKVLYGCLRANVPGVARLAQSLFRSRRPVGWVSGAALFIRKSLYERIGRFDPAMFMYFEDKDICARAWSEGMSVIFDPTITLTHIKGGSSPEHLSPRLKKIYRRSQIRYYEAPIGNRADAPVRVPTVDGSDAG
jgi:GT2 family glycosyltransferase